jgi:ubiquinol-cytochrome c reductase cytochrome b subunit
MRLWFPAIALLLIGSTEGLASSGSQRAQGAAVFADSGCMHCHTIRNKGGNKGPDLSGVGRKLTEAQIRKQVLYGSKIMPAFGDVLSDRELTDLLAYLRSCRDKGKK